MIANAYAAVMNPEVNPLRQLPKMVRFQIMTSLALMWSIVFALWTGMIMWVGPSMFVHAILLIGVFFTGDALERASKKTSQIIARNMSTQSTAAHVTMIFGAAKTKGKT